MAIDDRRAPSEAKSARIGSLARLPVFLSLDGKRAVLAGGFEHPRLHVDFLRLVTAEGEVETREMAVLQPTFELLPI